MRLRGTTVLGLIEEEEEDECAVVNGAESVSIVGKAVCGVSIPARGDVWNSAAEIFSDSSASWWVFCSSSLVSSARTRFWMWSSRSEARVESVCFGGAWWLAFVGEIVGEMGEM